MSAAGRQFVIGGAGSCSFVLGLVRLILMRSRLTTVKKPLQSALDRSTARAISAIKTLLPQRANGRTGEVLVSKKLHAVVSG